MKKLILITGAVLIAYLLLVTVVTQEAQAPATAGVQTQSAKDEKEYRIGAADGRVAVFRNGELYLKTDTVLSSLPKSDRNRLEEGIDIDSLKELKERLQDYCS